MSYMVKKRKSNRQTASSHELLTSGKMDCWNFTAPDASGLQKKRYGIFKDISL